MDEGVMEVEVSVAEADVTGLFVLPEEIDEDGMELVVSMVVLVLPEVVDADSPLSDVVLVVEALSTPLEKIRMQARTATCMP